MFKLEEDGKGNIYVEVSGPLTPEDWKDVRIALIPEGKDEASRPCIRLYNWTGPGKTGNAPAEIPLDAIPAFKQAIDFLLIKGANTIK